MDDPQPNTQYSLSSAEFTTIGQSDCMDASDAKIMIERDGSNVVYIDWITFETYSGIWYRIDGYCADFQPEIDYYLDPSYGYTDWIQEESGCPLGYSHVYFCVDNDVSSNGCAPAKQIWHFDVSSPNEYIFDSVWEDGTAVVPQIITCNPSNEQTPSPTDHPSNRPTASPSNDPSNEPTASPIATHDPSTGPTASPNEPTSSRTDHPFAQPTASPTHSTADTTNTNHGSTSTGNVSMDSALHDQNLYILSWIGIICVLLICAFILCFMVWKCHRQLKEVQQDAAHIADSKTNDTDPGTQVTQTSTKDLMNVSNVLQGSVVDEDEQMDSEEDSVDSLYVNKHATNDRELRTAGETGVDMGIIKPTDGGQ
eukprot:820029_1